MKTKILLATILIMSIFSLNATAQSYCASYNNNHNRYYENHFRNEDRCRHEYRYFRDCGRDGRLLINPIDILIPGRRIIRHLLF